MRALLLALVVLSSWCLPAQAQRRWIIDETNAWRLNFIYQQAAPGDVLLLRFSTLIWNGIAGSTLYGKGVTIRGDNGQPTEVIGPAYIADVPAGQSMMLENLWFQSPIRFYDCVGAVILRNVRCEAVWPHGGGAALAAVDCSQVEIIDCALESSAGYYGCYLQPQAGLDIERSRVTLSRCAVFGSYATRAECLPPFSYRPYYYWIAEGVAIKAVDSSLLLFETHVERFHPASPGTELTNSRFLASPPPMQWINGRAGISQVHLYGQGASAGGSVTLTQNPRLLPSTRATLTGNRLRLEVRNGGIDSPGFMGIGLQPAHVLLAPFGHHGAILVPTNQSQSAVFDRLVTDTAGSWTREYVVPQPLLAQLLDHYFVFQALMFDASQTIWAGSPDVVRF